jgi:penicillin-binding protein 2
VLALVLLAATGCTAGTSIPPVTPTPSAPGMPPPGVPDPRETTRAYLDAWQTEDYPAMYSMLTSISQDAITPEEFSDHYQGISTEAALKSIDYEILSSLTNPDTAQVGYRVFFDSALAGEFRSDTLMNLTLEDGQWRVQWDDTLVMPQLKGSNYLSMVRQGYAPARANIYDRNGHALAAQGNAVALGLYPDQIDPAQADLVFAQLSELTGLTPEAIQSLYANFPAGQGWYLPLGEFSTEVISPRLDVLEGLSGIEVKPYKSRYYVEGGLAPHILGYMGAIPPDEVENYMRLGYQADERVGLAGLEKWGEPYLSGGRGGALYVLDAEGKPVTKLAEAAPQPSQAIYTTIDKDFQATVQDAMSGFKGAAVVLERDTGRVLAMVSSPGFNPNAFEPVNFNSQSLLTELEDPSQPLLNRATQGLYPLGSVFKIITTAAAIESGLYTPESSYYCDTVFKELQGATLYDWTHDYGFNASGQLTLLGGLIRSCNPWFYHIGLDFYNRGMTNTLSNMARGFGLGQLTGIEGVDEAAGQVQDMVEPIDATNNAIGQGALQVTPLQVARFLAAIGNGGTLYQPQVIQKIVPPDGPPTYQFKPVANGKLPIDKETLEAIQEALVGVISSTEPRGTAYHVFTGLDIPVAGKTGTAQTGIGAPHAWFAGYTDAGREDYPDIAIAVIAESAGEGSVYAAPIFRRIVELYYQGTPGKLYDWETTYDVTRTPDTNLPSTPVP